jgi:hypothetical protein
MTGFRARAWLEVALCAAGVNPASSNTRPDRDLHTLISNGRATLESSVSNQVPQTLLLLLLLG